jgi:hypothetical protein
VRSKARLFARKRRVTSLERGVDVDGGGWVGGGGGGGVLAAVAETSDVAEAGRLVEAKGVAVALGVAAGEVPETSARGVAEAPGRVAIAAGVGSSDSADPAHADTNSPIAATATPIS